MAHFLALRYRKSLILAMAVFITLLLVYFLLSPTRLVRIWVHQGEHHGITLYTRQVITSVDHGAVSFEIDGQLEDARVSPVTLSIRAPRIGAYFNQAEGYAVMEKRFFVTVHLCSQNSPLVPDEPYIFMVLSRQGKPIAEGDILAHVYLVAAPSSWFFGALGVLASVLQVILFFFTVPTKTQLK